MLPDPLVMALIGRASFFGGEPDLRLHSKMVDPKRAAIDIGAADGVYSWHLSRISHRCIAFEAHPLKAEQIRRRLPQIEFHQCALSSTCGSAVLRVPVDGRALTGLGSIESENSLGECEKIEEISVLTRTLDSFGLRDVGFIKIDVEGHELEVLKGARNTLLRERPVLLLEIEERHRRDAVASVESFLSACGYSGRNPAASPQNHLFYPASR